MAACELLDFRCLLVNELIGSTVLAVIFAAIFYFIIAGKLRWGFDTTVAVSVPIVLISGLMITGFSIMFAIISVVVGLMIAFIFNIIIGNR